MAAKETADEEMAKAAADVAEEAAAEEMETEMAAEETAAEETAAEETEAEEMAADETATKGTATEDMAAESAEEDTAVEMAVVELAAVASTIDEFAKIAEAATSRFRLPAARLAAPLGCVRFCWRPVRSCLRPVRSWLRPLRSRWSCRLTKVTAFPRSLIEAKRAGRLWEEEELDVVGGGAAPMHVRCISTLDAHHRRQLRCQGSLRPRGMSGRPPRPRRRPGSHDQAVKCLDPAVRGETRPQAQKLLVVDCRP